MARHGAREQKKLAKKKAKQNQKKRELARLSSNNPAIRLQGCESWPVQACHEPEDMWREGFGQLAIARRAPNGELLVGIFLVDTFCLGVKNAFWKAMSAEEFKTLKSKLAARSPLRSVPPERLKKIILDAVDYAQSLGFPPHADYRHVALLLQGIDETACADTFVFGKDGKPFYIRGPYESLEKAQSIVKRVNAAGGHFVIPLDDGRFEPTGMMFGPDDDFDLEGDFAQDDGELLEDEFDAAEGDYLDIDEAPPSPRLP